MTIDQAVANLSRQLKGRGIPIAEAARAMGLSQPGLSQILSGHIKPTMATLGKLANFLGLKVVWDSETGYRIEPKDTA